MIPGCLFMPLCGTEIFFATGCQTSYYNKPCIAKRLPNGYDATTIKNVIPTFSNNDLVNYSEPNTGTIASLIAPTVIQSYAEVEFLLAEASLRGWDASTAVSHYNAGINASMKTISIFPTPVLFGSAGAFHYHTNTD